MAEETLLFEGLKVLDVGSWIAGPVAGTMLADRGAEVIKVEVPVMGDGYRHYAILPFTANADVNYTWALDARNKRSIALNLKTEEGMRVLEKLIAWCDVYITNQPLPLRRQLKLEYEDIKHLNERMIYSSLTPYGEQGPDSDNEAFDLVAYWNRSGLMNKMRHDGIEPVQAMAGMGDHPTAVAFYASIVTALYQRERTGKGCKAYTSLLANGVWSASCLAQATFAGADFSPMQHPQRMTAALYGTRDDRWIQINMVRSSEAIDQMLVAMEAFELLADERLSTLEGRMEHPDEFTARLREVFATKTADEWVQILKVDNKLPIEKVATFEDLLTDPHLKLNGMVAPPIEDVGIDYIINDPVNVEGVARIGAKKAPELGEHTDEILAEFGYDPEAIVALREKGVLQPLPE
ncbi:MAG TPA: CoA transferase [Pseudomonadales bacterium]|nr:CoA transferase [Pseudomonadales bacterium]